MWTWGGGESTVIPDCWVIGCIEPPTQSGGHKTQQLQCESAWFCGGVGLTYTCTHTHKHTSLIFSLHSLYCFFWVSRKVVSSFFCWATICCWNFFSSASTTFIWGKEVRARTMGWECKGQCCKSSRNQQQPSSCHFRNVTNITSAQKQESNCCLLASLDGQPWVKAVFSEKHLHYFDFTRDSLKLSYLARHPHFVQVCSI